MRHTNIQESKGQGRDRWESVLLDSLAKRGSGHTPDKKHSDYWNGTIKWVSLADSPLLDKVYIETSAETITAKGIVNSSAVLHPAGTVILSRDAGVGKSAIMRSEMAVSQHFMSWTCGPELDNHFLYYWLQSYKSEFERVANGTTIKTIGLPYFRALKICKPPITEQRAIANALGDADALITALDRLIAKKRDIKQATMQQLLTGKTRLAGFNSPWIKKRFGDISDYVDGEITAGGDDGYIEIGDIDVEKKTYDVSQKTKLSVPGAVKVPAGTLLISTVRPTRGAIAVTSSAIHVSSAFCRLSPKNGLLLYLASQSTFLSYLGENSFGGTYPTCRDETILGYETIVPADPKEQNAIAGVLSDMDAELSELDARRDKTRNLKQGMMQELLTGKTRLI